MYRAALEYILGFKLEGEQLRIDPCIPRFWREFEITYRRGNTTYRIKVENPNAICRGVASVVVDGTAQPDDGIKLIDDGKTHEISIVMGPRAEPEKEAPRNSETAETEKAR